MCKAYIIFGILSFIIFSSYLFAEEPPGEKIGAQVERFQADIEQKKKELEPKKVKPPKIEKEEEERPPVEGPTFILKEVKITGSTIFKPQDFRPIYEPYLGKEVTFKEIETIAREIEQEYIKRGYLTTIVYIPEQEVKDGVIEIRIAEGKMGSLSIEENKWFSSSLIGRYFHTKKNEILNIKKLQKDILRLNQNPDLEVRTIIGRGEEPQTSDITLKIKERFPYHIGTGVDNQGTRLVGRYRTIVSARSTNLTGLMDSLFVNTLLSPSSFGESVSYLLPINTYGTKLGFDFTYFTLKLGKEFKSLDISGNTQIYTPHILWELYLSEHLQANADMGIEIKSIKKKMGEELTTDDQLRLPYLGFDLTKFDPTGENTTFSPRFTFGTAKFLGASSRGHSKASRADTGGFFFKYEQTLRRIQRMPFESYLSIRSRFQAATHTLPSSEQFQLGGANSIRGYPEGDYLADIGAVANFDWVFPLYLIPKGIKLPYSNVPLRNQIQPVFLVDLGGGRVIKTTSGEKGDKFLMGIGGGLKVQIFNNIYVRLEWAGRAGERPTKGAGSSTFYFTFQSEI